MPLSATDSDSSPDNTAYEEGIHCKHCVDSLTDKKKTSLQERHKQIQLAADKNSSHLGLQVQDIKATRTLKKLKRMKKPISPHNFGSLIVITRVHCKSATSLVSIDKIVDFAQHCVPFADKILILLGISFTYMEHRTYLEDLLTTLKNSSMELFQNVQIEVIMPWVGFTAPLNVGIRLALDAGFDYVLFQVGL